MSADHHEADPDADELADVLIENERVDRDLEQLAEVEGLQQRGGVSYKVRRQMFGRLYMLHACF